MSKKEEECMKILDLFISSEDKQFLDDNSRKLHIKFRNAVRNKASHAKLIKIVQKIKETQEIIKLAVVLKEQRR